MKHNRQFREQADCPLSEIRLNISSVLDKDIVLSVPQPQADKVGCGTLGFLYLKELLKDNANQLHKYTLSFPIYDGNNLCDFLFPSPQVLRYSQSSKYNELLRTMLTDSSDMQVIQEVKLKVAPLRKLLEDSIQQAKLAGNHSVVEHNIKIIEQLPRFRTHWQAAYGSMKVKRKSMQVEGEPNDYLAYSSHRLNARTLFFKTADNKINLPELKGLLSTSAEPPKKQSPQLTVSLNTAKKYETKVR